MQTLYYALILFLLLTLVAGLWRIRRGPTAADRMLAAQLFGTTATAILLLLAEVSAVPALRDVALVLALLAAITVTAFTRRTWRMAPANAVIVDESDADAIAMDDAVATEAAVNGVSAGEGSTADGDQLGGLAGGLAGDPAEGPAGDRHAR